MSMHARASRLSPSPIGIPDLTVTDDELIQRPAHDLVIDVVIVSAGPPLHFRPSFLAGAHVQEAQEQRKAKMARYTPRSAPYEELQAARAQRLEVH